MSSLDFIQKDFFWKNDRHFISHLAWQKHPYIVFINWGHFCKQPVLIATTGGKEGIALEHEGAREGIKKELLYTLQRMFGKTTALTGFAHTHWWTDPFSEGAYSHLPVGVESKQFDALAAPIKHLHFAGEATTQRYLATVHGALLSGKRAAREIALGMLEK
ncbi:FAD-dependent oxidoreductase [uncultured Microscilla sp.]|uniref:flavin monoamine oxidase family protein n=1 Tax=uncultured Microscilla sp. TaxID=432653 RepID=UPI0026369DC9|nr:FAD-dependent oxidoreductase [uncultured Microscilla sp.]